MKKILALVLALVLVGSMIPTATAETAHSHNVCADSSCKEHSAVTWQPWSNATTLPTSGQYYLTTDVTMSAQVKTTGNLKLCLNGHTVTATNGARHLMVGFGYTFDLTDCGTTGKLTGGAAAWGASISLDYKATFNLYGGTITGNSNTASSGGIGAIYLRAGKVSGSTHTAGGTMNMYGGTITGNTGKSAGAIYIGGGTDDLLDGTLNMYGGTITGNTCASGAVYTATNAQVNLLGGAPVIRDNQGSNLNLGANGSLQVKDLKAGAKIFVNATTARTISANTDKDYASFFEADNASWSVFTQGGKLALSAGAHKHNICADSTCADHGTETWSPWTDPTTLPLSGQYYLTTDVTLTAAIKTTGDLKLCLNGCTVTATNGARHLMVGYGYTFSLTDCGTTGKLTGGTAAWGASISLDYKGTFNMYGGTITGNSSTASSGGIGAIYLRAGKVSGSTHTAGGTMNLYGGTISGNTGKSAGAIYIGGNTDDLLDGILNVYGGTITGNNCTSGAVYTATNAQVNLLGGKPVIADNQGGNLNLGANGNLQVKDLQTGAKISVAAASARAISTETDKDYAEFFQADNSTLAVRTENGKLTLVSGHLHNVCADAGCTDHEEETWTAWTKADSLPTEGRYYLDTDVQLSAQVKTTGDLQLCLNGHTVTAGAGARHFVAAYGTTLSLTDCGTTGKLTGGTAAWGASISLDYTGIFNMYGGTIAGNGSTADSGGIGAIYVRPGKVSGSTHTAGGTMNLYGGTISGNTGKISGAIYVGGSTSELIDGVFYMYGGQISGNTSKGAGGAITGAGEATIQLLGGQLTGNSAASDGGAVAISNKTQITIGSVTVSGNTAPKGGGIVIRSNATNPKLTGNPQILGNQSGNLHLGGTLVMEISNLDPQAKLGISADKAFRSISTELDAALATSFTSDRSAFFVEHRDGKLYLGAASGHDHCLCSNTSDKCDHTVLTWAPWEDPTTLPTEGTYYLTVDVVMTNTVETSGDLQLCLNGHTVTAPQGKRHMNITKNCFFELTDCAEKPGKFTGGTQTYGASISIRTAGAMSLYGGKFSGNSNESEGGAIYLQAAQKFGTTEYAGAKFYMYGGEISGNTALIGGGISVGATSSQYFNDQTYDGSLEDPVLHIYGGKIVNNVSTGNGGGIYTRAYSDSQILGGIISGNTAKLSGGGVYANGQCDLQLIGGVIEKNSAGKYGGGVHGTVDAVIHLSGTPIRNNTAKESGGGVGLSGGAQLLMTGGTISGNTSANGGGVISMSKAVITLKGGSITGNTASKNAGGIYVSTNTFFHMYGGSISYNKATGHAGGIYFLKSSGYLYGGSLTGNEGTNGGALYTNSAVTFQMYGGSIYGNTARTSAGGIYLFATPSKLMGGRVYNNNAASSGGAMLLGGKATTLVENVKFYDNQANGAGAIIVQGSAIMEMKDCQITDNLARTGHGGGLYVSNSSDVNITNTLFSGNEANNGGAYYAPIKSNGTLNNCLLENNVARAVGGAVYTRGNLNINGSTIRNNIADKNGGAIATWKNGSQNLGFQPGLLVSDTLIENNTAGARGGGLYLELGNNAQLTNVTITGNSAGDVGGALYAIDDLYMHGITVTGNTSGGDGYAVYLDDNRYDGHSYTTGLLKMCGDIIVRDNQGGDLYLGATATIAACAEDFGPKTYIDLTLDSGVLTNRVFGTYDYEGGDCHYILTYGDRSLTDPETVPQTEQPTQEQTQEQAHPRTETNDTILYVLVGVVALVIVAVVLLILKKKKPAGAEKK